MSRIERLLVVIALSTVAVEASAQSGGEGGVGGVGAFGGAAGAGGVGEGGSVASPDADDDGYSVADGDCDDNDAQVNPSVNERCNDGKDNDCDGVVDGTDCNSYDSGPTAWANVISGLLLGGWMAVGTWRRRRKLPR